MYNVDWPAFVRRNTPSALRLPVFLAVVRVLVTPLKGIQNLFEQLRLAIAEEYRWNGLVHSLEKLLNERYDPINQAIYILTNTKLPIWYWKDEAETPDWYWKDEGDTLDFFWLDEAVFNAESATKYEFTIYVPPALSFVPSEMLELVDIYRFAGFRPRIVTIGTEIEFETDYYILSE